MSKINALRIINLNYNNNAIRINDEMFHFNGESTLLSLRNGGGKSVLVQMMTAPFVHKRYRDAKDRPFESYFTNNKPAFIMVEWALDKGAGYVMTGMMVRKNQEMSEERGDELEIFNFISEYREPCVHDISQIPVVEKTKKEINLKGFAACRQLFETYRKDRSMEFYFYDMNHPAQSKQYFEKLKEYQIYYKEWETIIKKVNLKESGLSDLFSDCRDEKGLVEKWFLDAVESKLNKDKNRMKEFESIVTKYVNQYKDNRSKIERRDTIRLFTQEAAVILTDAGVYQQASEQVLGHENRIAWFMKELYRLAALTRAEEEELRDRLESVEEEIRRIGYEKLSYEIHGKEEEKSYHVSNRDMLSLERDSLEKEYEDLSERLKLLQCARWRDETAESQKEFKLAGERLEVLKKKQEDLTPGRDKLGAALKLWCEAVCEELIKKQKDNETEQQETKDSQTVWREREKEYQSRILEAGIREGSLKTKITSYDREEDRFNQRYQEDLKRNILGEYEPAALEMKLQAYEKEQDQERRDQTARKRKIETVTESLKSLNRMVEDSRRNADQAVLQKSEEERNLERYNQELKERRIILKYLELSEETVFDTDQILASASRKLKEIRQAKRSSEKELDEMEKEFQRLTQGKVLELPPEFEEMLDRIGIHYVYGMDWLKKNGNSAGKNQELVRANPFIPYALIVSEAELKKLTKYGETVYTSFPIPIIKREELEEAGEQTDGGLISMRQLSFYVLFNDNLLDEKKLNLMISQKEEQIGRKKHVISQKEREYREYFEKQEKIRNQSVTKTLYEELLNKIDGLEKRIKELLALLEEQKAREAKEELQLQTLREDSRKAERRIEYLARLVEDMGALRQQYEQYLSDKEALEGLEQKIESLREDLERSRKQSEALSLKMKTLEETHYLLKGRLNQAEEKKRQYESFDRNQAEEKEYSEEEILELESRYQAITEQICGEQKELEENLRKAGKLYEKNQEELDHLEKKYGLDRQDYQEVLYSRAETERIEEVMNQKKREKSLFDGRWNEEDKVIALLIQKIDGLYESMLKNFGKEEPLAKEELASLEFDARRNQAVQILEQEKEKMTLLERKLRGYEENLTALSEYNHLEAGEEVIWEADFAAMDYRELGNYKGIMIRDYRESMQLRQSRREALVQTINRIGQSGAFEDEFFKKPLMTLAQLTADAAQIILQLSTTLSSYESLMEKLEVDISMIEKERDKIIEILEDYVKEVHQNLGRIDKNSTITIRDRQIKMLKLQLPDWEENQAVYHIRLQDFMEEITLHSMEILEKNENAAEFLGGRVTTKCLYDTVVGIGNVEIRLYKIEERREYPITWAEVAKNSGGEGFLSAFVILNSLLYYMRKDDTDIFADRTEGKVLVMDNPFAQTNAAHLLKPLMDMAKKADTQLICLSGLGGESIYNRFNNIYVLNLISANLRNGMQYLKADHIRGSEEEEMILSRIEVAEQLELEF